MKFKLFFISVLAALCVSCSSSPEEIVADGREAQPITHLNDPSFGAVRKRLVLTSNIHNWNQSFGKVILIPSKNDNETTIAFSPSGKNFESLYILQHGKAYKFSDAFPKILTQIDDAMVVRSKYGFFVHGTVDGKSKAYSFSLQGDSSLLMRATFSSELGSYHSSVEMHGKGYITVHFKGSVTENEIRSAATNGIFNTNFSALTAKVNSIRSPDNCKCPPSGASCWCEGPQGTCNASCGEGFVACCEYKGGLVSCKCKPVGAYEID